MLKKILFTTACIPLGYQTHWAYNWQKGRKIEKEAEIKEKVSKLRQPLVDVSIKDLEVNEANEESFTKEWLYRPIRIKGIFDNEQEHLIQRPQSGEKGLQVVTPFYTEADENGQLRGLFVDRGWLNEEYKGLKVHWGERKEQYIEGVVCYGEGKSFTGKNNDETNKIRIDLEEFLKKTDFVNKEQAMKVIIKEVNFTQDQVESKSTLKRPTPGDLCYWYVTPERHQAYSTFWLYATGLNVFANILIWVYL